MQLRFRHLARNVLSNWLATAANLAVGFFLAPFVVHRLGNLAYGVWVLAISSVNYLNLLDMGMRSSVLRFVSKGWAKGDHEAASDAMSAAFWVRLQIGGVVLLLSSVLAWVFPLLFKVPPDLALDAREAILVIGTTTAITMALGVFGGVLSALNRYDLQSVVTLVQLCIRVAGVVLVLRAGHGIVAIAFCELAAAVVGNLLLYTIARRIYPELGLRLKRPSGDILRQLWSYSVYAFMVTIAIQLVYQTDNLVVGAFVSASAVTFYSIGNSLCRYADQIVGAMTSTFVPAASGYEAAGDHESLRRLYIRGTQATLAVSLPVVVTLLTRGRNFIGLWMGPQYEKTSAAVLMLLASALLFSSGNNTAGSIAYGLEKHKWLARWSVGEAILNLALSIMLARHIGILGVAFGTLLPSLIVHVIIWPFYVHQLVGIDRRDVLLRVWAPMYVSAIPFAAASYALGRYRPAHSVFGFVYQTLFILPVFAGSLSVVFRDKVAEFMKALRLKVIDIVF